MPDDILLTLRQLAEQLDLPESTVRYYRDAFLDRIPSVGSGRRRRYPRQAVDVLRAIARSYAAGRSKSEIVAAIGRHDPRPALVAVPSGKAAPARGIGDISNLDLLAAILDGEREQREALWQMAKEIVRLTDVLEGQDKVLNEIADQAGVRVGERTVLSGGSKAALGAGQTQVPTAPPNPAPVPPDAAPATAPTVVAPPYVPPAASVPVEVPAAASWMSVAPSEPAPASAPTVAEPNAAPEPAPWTTPAAHSDIDRLRVELEAERALVERLREAKLQFEHRAVGAEAELHERRRSSVISRIFRGDDPA